MSKIIHILPIISSFPSSSSFPPSLPPLLHIFLSSSSLHLSSLLPPLPSSSPLLPSFCFVLSSSKTNPRHHISPRNTSAGLRACTHNLCNTCPSWEREWTRIEQPRASLTCLHPLAQDPGMSSASRGDPPLAPAGLWYSSQVLTEKSYQKCLLPRADESHSKERDGGQECGLRYQSVRVQTSALPATSFVTLGDDHTCTEVRVEYE